MICTVIPLEELEKATSGLDTSRIAFGTLSLEFVLGFCALVKRSSSFPIAFFLVIAEGGKYRALVYRTSLFHGGIAGKFLPRAFRECAIVDIPLFQIPSVAYDNGTSERDQIIFLKAMIRSIRRELRVVLVLPCHDASSAAIGRHLSRNYGIGKTTAHTSIDLDYDSFDRYLDSLPGKKRRYIRATKARFAARGGHSAVFDSAPPDGLFPLYQALKQKKGDGGPIRVGPGFFQELFLYGACAPGILVLYEGSVPCGFSTFFIAGSTLYLKLGGLDYERLHYLRSYYNLFYSAIELAIERGCKRLDCGLTTNKFKEDSLGCTVDFSCYSVVTIPILGHLASQLARLISRGPSS